MSKKYDVCKKRCVVMLGILILSAITIAFVHRDVSGSATKIAADNLQNDAEIFTTYFDSVLEGKVSHLQQLAKEISTDVYQDSEKTRQTIDNYRSIFYSISVLNQEGKREYGDEINLNLSQEELLESLIYDQEPVVYNELIRDRASKNVLVFCVPIFYDSSVSGVVMGTVPVNTISKMMETWGDSRAGCAFLVNTKGNYLTSGKKFNQIIGGKANSYFTYLDDSKIAGKEYTTTEIERRFKKGESVSFRYNYGGDDYITALFPSTFSNWYVGYAEGVSVFYNDTVMLSQYTIFLLFLTGTLWVVLIGLFVYATYKNVLYREEIERYEIIREQERSVIFEFQFSPKRLEFFGDVQTMFNVEPHVLMGEEVYDIYDFVHKDDRSLRGRIHQFYDSIEDNIFSAEVRIKNGEDSYGWYRVSGMMVKDPKIGINTKFVGKVENADQQIAEEKDLVQRAENDMLTGVLNKKTMEGKVVKALAEPEQDGNCHYIFFMVDLDNFKNVNDKLGHIYGDTAIVDTANCLSAIFPNNAYVGRLGGDEFAVCAKYDAFDKESLISYIKKKADKICEANRRTYVNGAISVGISSSVGIAVAPDFAQDFKTLYQMADQALYRSKNGGKNCYHIYGRD